MRTMKSINSHDIKVEQLNVVPPISLVKKLCSSEASKDNEPASPDKWKDFSCQDSKDAPDNRTVEVVEEHLNEAVKECCIWVKEVPLSLVVEEDPLLLKKGSEEAEFAINNSDMPSNNEPISLLSESDSPIKTEEITSWKSTRFRTAKIITDYGSTDYLPSPRPLLKISHLDKVIRGSSVINEIFNKYKKREECSTNVKERISEGELSDNSKSLTSVDSPAEQQTHSKVPLRRVSSRHRILTKKCCQSCSDPIPISTELCPSDSQIPTSRNQIMPRKLRKSVVKKIGRSSIKVKFPEMPLMEKVNFYKPERLEENSISTEGKMSRNDHSVVSESEESEGSIIVVDDEPAHSEVPKSRISIRNRIIKTPAKSCHQQSSSLNNIENTKEMRTDYRSENPPNKYPRRLKTKLNRRKRTPRSGKTMEQIYVHNRLEQLRRAELNELFQELKALLPSGLKESTLSKNSILVFAKKYINELSDDAKYSENQIGILLNEQKRLLNILNKKILEEPDVST